MNEGFIFLHRKLLHWSWFHDSNMVHLFIYLLLKANYEDSKYKDQEIKRGTLVFGRLQASKDTGIPEYTIRYCLKRLKLIGEISIQLANNFSVITICNYEYYQSKQEKIYPKIVSQISQPLANDSPTFSQPLATYKEDNNIIKKEEKENNKGADEFFSFEIFWKLYNKNINEPFCRTFWHKELTTGEKEMIHQCLPAYIEATPDKKFRKDPLNYLVEKAWLNEIVKPGAAPQKPKSAIDLYIESQK